jgi:hypothetical protein
VAHAVARLQKSSSLAVDTLVAVMTDAEAKDMARVSAARTILEFALHATDVEDLATRIKVLEEGLKR